MSTSKIRLAGLAAAALLVSGCGGLPSSSQSDAAPETKRSDVAGDPAVWSLAPHVQLDRDSTSFTALVSRLGCSGGETGEVLPPEVRPMKDQVIVTFRVASLTERDHNCPGNNQVAYDVLLHEPLGDRVLVDGECLDGAAAADTSFCDPDGVRLRTTADDVS